MPKLLKTSELKARIQSSKILIENYRQTQDMGFLKKAISMLLFREHGLENYQPLYISHGAIKSLGAKCAEDLIRYMSVPRSRIFPAAAGRIRKLGHDYSDFVVEHVVDVSSMVNYLLESSHEDIEDLVMSLGRTCPICIVSKKEDLMLKRSDRDNIKNPWAEYDRVKISRTKIRDHCGPLKTLC